MCRRARCGAGSGRNLILVSDYSTVGVVGAESISQMFDSGTLANSSSVSKKLAVSSSFSQNQVHFSAAATVDASANLGRLQDSSSNYSLGSGTGAGTYVTLTWTDTLTVVAPTLSPTTPVQLSIEMDISPFILTASNAYIGSVLEEVGMGFAASGPSAASSVNLSAALCDGDAEGCFPPTDQFPLDQSAILTTYPGATISLAGLLSATGNAEGYTMQSPCASNPCSTNYQSKSGFTGSVDFYVVPLTTGTSYVSASGMSYLPGVPEPSTKALLLAGLAGLMLVLRAGWWRSAA